eukprot:TRINITY_DN11286_c0_g1_i1.p1 TRINITY_DN11286_c0_g1~~TRINITY_DN11286_c0_g1_i1.p1  ORF type:complete len:752 (-),score=185.89 TRINITY_DN11286_c0_g1_i1:29-2284(-)
MMKPSKKPGLNGQWFFCGELGGGPGSVDFFKAPSKKPPSLEQLEQKLHRELREAERHGGAKGGLALKLPLLSCPSRGPTSSSRAASSCPSRTSPAGSKAREKRCMEKLPEIQKESPERRSRPNRQLSAVRSSPSGLPSRREQPSSHVAQSEDQQQRPAQKQSRSAQKQPTTLSQSKSAPQLQRPQPSPSSHTNSVAQAQKQQTTPSSHKSSAAHPRQQARPQHEKPRQRQQPKPQAKHTTETKQSRAPDEARAAEEIAADEVDGTGNESHRSHRKVVEASLALASDEATGTLDGSQEAREHTDDNVQAGPSLAVDESPDAAAGAAGESDLPDAADESDLPGAVGESDLLGAAGQSADKPEESIEKVQDEVTGSQRSGEGSSVLDKADEQLDSTDQEQSPSGEEGSTSLAHAGSDVAGDGAEEAEKETGDDVQVDAGEDSPALDEAGSRRDTDDDIQQGETDNGSPRSSRAYTIAAPSAVDDAETSDDGREVQRMTAASQASSPLAAKTDDLLDASEEFCEQIVGAALETHGFAASPSSPLSAAEPEDVGASSRTHEVHRNSGNVDQDKAIESSRRDATESQVPLNSEEGGVGCLVQKEGAASNESTRLPEEDEHETPEPVQASPSSEDGSESLAETSSRDERVKPGSAGSLYAQSNEDAAEVGEAADGPTYEATYDTYEATYESEFFEDEFEDDDEDEEEDEEDGDEEDEGSISGTVEVSYATPSVAESSSPPSLPMTARSSAPSTLPSAR